MSSSAKMSSKSSRRPAPTAQAAHVRALAVTVLELGLRLVGLVAVVIDVGIALLGEAEVHERAVPGIAKRHA
jgi:hypothetical protein